MVHFCRQKVVQICRDVFSTVWSFIVVPLITGCCKRQNVVRKFTFGHAEEHKIDLENDFIECGDDNFDILLLSGGGSYGAYGTGFINGWYETGNLPKFKVVTGVSTGALMAPHTFVGEKQDMDDLRRVYTGVSDENIYRLKNPWEALTDVSTSIYTTSPLKNLLDDSFPNHFIDRVAIAGASGRKLYVGVACLNTGEFEAWDMVKLAKRKEYDLFRKILLASSAIPIVFPPVTIKDKMYVDGGTAANIFLYEEMIDIHEKIKNSSVKMNVYAIMNGKRSVIEKCVNQNSLAIAIRSLDVLFNANEEADVKTFLCLSKYHGIPFRMTYIPKTHTMNFKSALDFNTDEMKRLFMIGENEAKRVKWGG